MRTKTRSIFAEMTSCVQMIMHISALAECTNLHKDYLDGISGICGSGLLDHSSLYRLLMRDPDIRVSDFRMLRCLDI